MAILKDSLQKSEHWYTREGKALHTMPLADGDGTRPTTLADARKLGLYPSVSAILQILDKPGLDKWKQEQVALAAIKFQRAAKESDDYYVERLISESRKTVKDAGDFGTGTHGEMERYWFGRLGQSPYQQDPKLAPFVNPTIKFVEDKKIVPVANEVKLINHAEGFGGTSDLPCLMGTKPGVVDYKTKRTKPGEPIDPFPDQAMQIAAYAATYWKERLRECWGLNIFISSTEPGRTEGAAYSAAQLMAEWEVFKMLCKVWRHLNGYDPRVHGTQTRITCFDYKHLVIATVGGTAVSAAPVKNEDAPTAPLAPVAPPTTFPEGATFLSLLRDAACDLICDGIRFLKPEDCTDPQWTAKGVKTDYAWYYNAAQNAGKVSIKNDAGIREHGWLNAFPAYPADLTDFARAENAGRVAPPLPSPDELPLKVAKAKATKKIVAPEVKGELIPTPPPVVAPPVKKTVDAKKRIVEIENMAITFGKFKKHPKVKTIGDLPASYLDYLRDVANVPTYIKEYLAFPLIIKRIEAEIK